MRSKVFIALAATALSVILHGYLTFQHYPLKLGIIAGQSLCSLNDKFNCEVVAASEYSSVMGMPLALFGMSFNVILFIVILVAWLGFTDFVGRWYRFAFLLATGSVLASLVMAGISLTQMSTYCLFCIALYVLSAVTFESLRRVQGPKFLGELKNDFVKVAESKGLIAMLVSIPVLAFVGDRVIADQYGAGKLNQLINRSLYDWQSNPAISFTTPALLSDGQNPPQAKMTVYEFADFRCSHCRDASHALHVFRKAHPDVHFGFYSFPLDGDCNPAIKGSAGGVSCRLAKATYCAEQQKAGWEMHDEIFGQFMTFAQLANADAVDKELKPVAEKLKIDYQTLVRCMNENTTHEAIVAQAKMGIDAQVEGTPSIFVNGRKLPGGQMPAVLDRAFDSLNKSN